MNHKTEETSNSQKLKLTRGYSRKDLDNRKSKPPDTSHTRSEESNVEGSTRGILFCPKCGSTDVFWASGLPQLWSVWDCRNCGYRGAFILRDSKLAQKLREDYAEKFAKR